MSTVFLLLIALSLLALFLKPKKKGGPHSAYFKQLNQELRKHSLYRPALLLDLDTLDRNIASLKSMLNTCTHFRIVVKSLPSIPLLDYIIKATQTERLMVFHQPFLNHIANHFPNADVLLGKPMPIGAAESFYQQLDPGNGFIAEKQLQWLVDTPERLHQYLNLANNREQKLSINIEIDVGLHRGGVCESQMLITMLDIIHQHPNQLEFSGFMGYDPHTVKLPEILKSAQSAHQESQAIYQTFIDVALAHPLKPNIKELCLNGAGSPTLMMHHQQTVCNDLSAGSGLVKPTDFDIPSLANMSAAAFIATPIIKRSERSQIPGIERFEDYLRAWNPNRERSYFIYGGKWMADYVSPPGLIDNPLFGLSTNHQLVNSSSNVDLQVDDFIFLRPHQSEFVFLQFGDLRLVRNGQILEQNWPVFNAETSHTQNNNNEK